MTEIMEDVNSSVVNRFGKPSISNHHSEGAQEDNTKQQHQQFVLGLDKNSCLQQKNTGK